MIRCRYDERRTGDGRIDRVRIEHRAYNVDAEALTQFSRNGFRLRGITLEDWNRLTLYIRYRGYQLENRATVETERTGAFVCGLEPAPMQTLERSCAIGQTIGSKIHATS